MVSMDTALRWRKADLVDKNLSGLFFLHPERRKRVRAGVWLLLFPCEKIRRGVALGRVRDPLEAHCAWKTGERRGW